MHFINIITVFPGFKLVCPKIHLSTNRMILNRIIVNLTGLHSEEGGWENYNHNNTLS